MLRLLIITIMSSSLLLCSTIDERLENLYKSSLSKHNVVDFTVHSNKTLEYPEGWSAYFITVTYNIKDKVISLRDVIFSDGISASNDFTILNNKDSLKSSYLNQWDKIVKAENSTKRE